MKTFTEKDMLNINYIENNDDGFNLISLGYNDFNYIVPMKIFRVQNIYTLHFILEGEGYIDIYGNRYRLKRGDMFFVPPNESMRYFPEENKPWKYIWVSFNGKDSEIYGKKMGFEHGRPVIECKRFHRAYSAVYEVFSRLENGSPVGYYAALSLFYKLLDAAGERETDVKSTLCEQVEEYILCHYHNQYLKVDDICRDFNISHSYLCRLFKERGVSVKSLLTDARINEAKRLLKETDLMVAEVGYSVGFTDTAHFMKTFKKYTGLPAGKYRAMQN